MRRFRLILLVAMGAAIMGSCENPNSGNKNYTCHLSDIAIPDKESANIDYQEQYIDFTFDKDPQNDFGFDLLAILIDINGEGWIGPNFSSVAEYSELPFEHDFGWCKISYIGEYKFRFYFTENDTEHIRVASLHYANLQTPIEVRQYPKGVTPPEE